MSKSIKSSIAVKSSSKTNTVKAASKLIKSILSGDTKVIRIAGGKARREGSWGEQSLNLIPVKKGITIEAFQELGGRRKDLLWDIKHGNVKVV